MNTYRNNNALYGLSGPFKAESREALADEMMPTFSLWAREQIIRDGLAENETDRVIDAMRDEFVDSLEQVYDLDDMREISLGIAAEMSDTDTAELIGTNNKQGDARVMVFELRGVRVAATNGNPVWEEQDAASFAELMETEGIEL